MNKNIFSQEEPKISLHNNTHNLANFHQNIYLSQDQEEGDPERRNILKKQQFYTDEEINEAIYEVDKIKLDIENQILKADLEEKTKILKNQKKKKIFKCINNLQQKIDQQQHNFNKFKRATNKEINNLRKLLKIE